jgi:16S rRNA (cytidine1402-2'-O)-methyltransferase
MPGTLFVVATPIGNLEDITLRAIRTLKEADLIAAEDTRRTAKLLAHYEIRRPVVSLHEHNEYREAPRLVERLKSGDAIALVSDAGTPGIADPGARLVAAARDAGVRVTPIPGPSAVTAALSVAGIAADQFVFMGFVPRSGAAREEWIAELAADPRAAVFFESPHRIERTAQDLVSRVNRPITWFKELTKVNEFSGISPYQAGDRHREARGEFVGVMSPQPREAPGSVDAAQANSILGRLTDGAGFDEEIGVVLTAHVLQSTPAKIRRAVKQHRILAKQQNRP